MPVLVDVINDNFSATQNEISINTNLVTQNVAITGSTFVHPALSVGTTLRYVRGSIGIGSAGVFGSAAQSFDLSSIKNDALDGQRRNVAVGLEHWFTDWLGIRGGSRVNLLATTIEPVGAIGLSLALAPGMFLDGQFTHGSGSIEESWGIAIRVGF